MPTAPAAGDHTHCTCLKSSRMIGIPITLASFEPVMPLQPSNSNLFISRTWPRARTLLRKTTVCCCCCTYVRIYLTKFWRHTSRDIYHRWLSRTTCLAAVFPFVRVGMMMSVWLEFRRTVLLLPYWISNQQTSWYPPSVYHLDNNAWLTAPVHSKGMHAA